MARYSVEFTPESRKDLWFYSAAVRTGIVKALRKSLGAEPTVETRNRKRLRRTPLAPWELRLGKYRVFYEVHEGTRTVRVTAVGHKQHERLLFRGQEVRT